MTEKPTPGDKKKLERLRELLSTIDSAVLAFSGGVDSTFLLKVAAEEINEGLIAATATSPTYIDEEYREALELADEMGVEHITLESNELENEQFRQNSPERCYHCKSELFGQLQELAEERDIGCVMDASNADDSKDYRPGLAAANELGVRSPLLETDLDKAAIRRLSLEMGLPTWNKPSLACLASRFPYGEGIDAPKLNRVERAEEFLRDLGYEQLRVRSHGDLARIEVEPQEVQNLAEPGTRQDVVERLKDIGFTYVTLDLQGYRTGSMNEELDPEERAAYDNSASAADSADSEQA